MNKGESDARNPLREDLRHVLEDSLEAKDALLHELFGVKMTEEEKRISRSLTESLF